MKRRCPRFIRAFLAFFCLWIPHWAWAADNMGILSGKLFTYSANDVSIGFLNQLFGDVGGLLLSSHNLMAVNSLMGKIFQVFNAGILMLAAFVMAYGVLITSLGMSQQGEMMMGRGKKASAGVALRVAFGISLLVPKFNGYSAIQVVVMWVVVQSVGFADNLWGTAINYYRTGGGSHVQRSVTDTASSEMTDFNSVLGVSRNLTSGMKGVGQIFSSLVCVQYHQKLLDDARLKKQKAQPSTAVFTPFTPVDQLSTEWGDASTNWVMRFPASADKKKNNACGQYLYPKGVTSAEDRFTLNQATHSVVGVLTPVAHDFVYNYDAKRYPKASGPLVNEDISKTGQPQPAIKRVWTYLYGANHSDVGNVASGIQQAVSGYLTYTFPLRINNQKNADQTLTKLLDRANDEGWLMAGRYVRKLAKTKAELQLKPMGNYVLTIDKYAPSPINQTAHLPDDAAIRKTYADMIGRVPGYALLARQLAAIPLVMDGDQTKHTIRTKISDYYSDAVEEANSFHGVPGLAKLVYSFVNLFPNPVHEDTMNMLDNAYEAWLDAVLVGNGEKVKNPAARIYDPLSRMAYLGTRLMGGVVEFWQKVPMDVFNVLLTHSMIIGALNTVWSTLAGFLYGLDNPGGYAGSAALHALMSLLQLAFQVLTLILFWYLPMGIALSTPLFVLGVTFGIYVPLMPFLLFLFGVIGWFIAVIEAMVASPLVALGVTHPEGHDLLGKAEQAVMLLLGVFLRAPCMIIGLLSAILLSGIVLNLFDNMFLHILKDNLDSWGGVFSGEYKNTQIFVAIIGMMLIYAMSLVSALTITFSLIYEIPNRLLRWLGMQAEQSGEQQQLGEIKSGVSSNVQAGGQAAGSVAGGVQQSGVTPGGTGKFQYIRKQKGSGGGASGSNSGGGGGDNAGGGG